uniref:IS110 family transposase n=1 Tax=Rubellimicrobium arenae TaxID=2817372 RepID=UPI001B3036DC
RATMRFVAVKTEPSQAAAMAYSSRNLLVRQRTQTINALRGHLAEYGVVAPAGLLHVGRLSAAVKGDADALPGPVVDLARVLLAQIAALTVQIDYIETQSRQRASQHAAIRRLLTVPGVGVIAASALTTFAPPPETFAKGCDFAPWVGLRPRQHSSGGKERLDKTTRMGQRDACRLLIIGAVAVVRWAARKGAPDGTWLARMRARQLRMLVAVGLANRMARVAWAMMRKEETYRGPAAVMA